MKKTIIFLILMITASISFGQTAEQLDRLLVFDYDLPDLGRLDAASLEALKGKFFVIYVSVQETEVTNREEESFQAVVTAVRGVWEDIDKLLIRTGEISILDCDPDQRGHEAFGTGVDDVAFVETKRMQIGIQHDITMPDNCHAIDIESGLLDVHPTTVGENTDPVARQLEVFDIPHLSHPSVV